MLQELGFHKQAVFFPFPEYWAGKLDVKGLDKARKGLDRLVQKHGNIAKGQLHYVGIHGAYSDHVANKLMPKTMDKVVNYAEMRDVMDKAIRLSIAGGYR